MRRLIFVASLLSLAMLACEDITDPQDICWDLVFGCDEPRGFGTPQTTTEDLSIEPDTLWLTVGDTGAVGQIETDHLLDWTSSDTAVTRVIPDSHPHWGTRAINAHVEGADIGEAWVIGSYNSVWGNQTYIIVADSVRVIVR